MHGTISIVAKRVAVVGGGLIGLACSHYLQRDGHEVIVLDEGQPDTQRCSTGNSGLIVPSHFIPLAAPGMPWYGLRQMFNRRGPFRIRPQWSPSLLRWMLRFWKASTAGHIAASAPVLRDLSVQSRELYLQLAEECGFRIDEAGLLMVCATEAALHHEQATATHAKELGIPVEVLGKQELEEFEPAFQAVGAVYFPQDASVDPLDVMAGLREHVRVQYGTKVDELVERPDGIVVAGVEYDAVVIASGVWSSALAASLGADLPIQPGKGYSLTYSPPPISLKTPAILVEGRVALTPSPTGLRIGGTLELGGTLDSVDELRLSGILETTKRYLPEFPHQAARPPVWQGLRPCSPDGMPIIGSLPRHPNVFVAAGHAMMGLSLAPVTGHLIASLVRGEPDALLSPLLSPSRFTK